MVESAISHQNALIDYSLPESEICNDGQDNNGDGLVGTLKLCGSESIN